MCLFYPTAMATGYMVIGDVYSLYMRDYTSDGIGVPERLIGHPINMDNGA